MRTLIKKTLVVGLSLGMFWMAGPVQGQIPDFRAPILGYVLDRQLHAIRPVVGILGSARIEAPKDLGMTVREAAFLSDQRHVIVATAERSESLVVDLDAPGSSRPIAGSSSSISMIRTSRDGTHAGLFDSETHQLLLIDQLPNSPTLRQTIDVSFAGFPLSRFAVSNEGIVLFAFHTGESDVIFAWTSATGPRFVTRVSRASDMAFLGMDAVVADVDASQILLIRNVRDQASPLLIADVNNGVSHPAALSVSSRNEIYVGNENAVVVMDATGHPLRQVDCGCAITTMMPLDDSSLRLTDGLDQPLFVLDSSSVPERILFVPALFNPASGTTQ